MDGLGNASDPGRKQGVLPPEQGAGDALVQQDGQDGDGTAFDDVQRGYCEEHEAAHAVDAAVDLASHGDDGIQGDAVKLRELRQQVHGVKCAAENRQDQRAEGKTGDGAVLALAKMVDGGCRDDKGAAYHKIGKITYKGGAGAFQKQLQQDLHSLAGDGGAGAQVKAAQHHGKLRKVQLIKFRRQEQQGKIQHVQHRGDCGAYADDGDAPGGGDLPLAGQKMLGKLCQRDQRGNDQNAHADKGQIRPDLFP